MLHVVWFKRDLRLHDHAPLAAAAAAAGPVLPLYIAEPDYWALPDTAGRQWEFIAECLQALRRDLAACGQPLVVRIGDVPALLERLHRQWGIAALYSHEETGNFWTYDRDRRVAAFCRARGIPWRQWAQFGVFRPLLDRDRWAARFEGLMRAPTVAAPARLPALAGIDPGDIPDAAALGLAPDPCPGRQCGGRAEGQALLGSFLAGRGSGYRKAMSSPLAGATACSRLSPHLALGTLSVREVLHRLRSERRRLSALPAAERSLPLTALDSLTSRLYWQGHFVQKLESEPELEFRSLHPAAEARRRRTPDDDPRLAAWAAGQTGFPFVDACMRSLATEGWLNFRMRAMVVAFATYHLGLDWQAVGLRLARLFTDYEPGIHWPQVQMQSGQTGINTPRIYNPVKQSLDQDPAGEFIARHVPELAALPPAYRHEPWRHESWRQPADQCPHYPDRIIDHEAAARAARERIAELRRSPGFRAAAEEVYRRHGSRKRRLDDDDPKPARKLKPKAQLALDL